MIRAIEVKSDDNYEDCSHCIYCDDTWEVCKARGCIHAYSESDFDEWYTPKESEE